MPGPPPTTLNPIPTTAAWNTNAFSVAHIGSMNMQGRDQDGRYISHILYSSFGDLTGDGWPEIVISGWSYRGFDVTGTAFPVPITLLSSGPNGVRLLSSLDVLGQATQPGTSIIRIADFNNDGRNDLFIGGHNESPFTLVPSTLFTWTPTGFSAQGSTFLTTAHEGFHGDFNGDGLLDVVMSAYHTQGPLPAIWTTGNSHGTTWYQSDPRSPAILLNLGDGQGGFRTYPIAFDHPTADLANPDAWTFANWSSGSAVAFADFDGDGRNDIVVTDLFARNAGMTSYNYIISNIQFESDSAYGSLTRLPLPYFDRDSTYAGAFSDFGENKSHDVQILIFDYNNDGLPDILINAMLWNSSDGDGGQDYAVTQVLRNDGQLRFTDVTDDVFFNAYLGKQGPGHDSILIDVNGDGFLDLVSTAEPDYVNGEVRPNSHSNEVFINTGDGKFVSVMWSQFGGLTEAVNDILISQGLGRGSFQGVSHTFFPFVRPDGQLAFITYENVHRVDGSFDQHYFSVTPNTAMSTGPGGINPATLGAAGFNEAYYLTTYSSVAAAVQAGQYASGLAHYLAVGRDAGLNAFARNAQIQGTSGNDVILLREGNEKAFGLAGDDAMQGGLGDDHLDGGTGFDVALYSGVRRQYTANSTTVSGNGEGTDTLVSIEEVRFVDGALTFDASSASAQVMRLYSATLNRVPDQGGLEANVANLARLGIEGLANLFVQSAEFQARFGALNNQQFVEQMYRFALGREGDAAGIAHWVGVMNGGATRGQMVVSFSESLEHQGRTAGTLNAGLWVPDLQAQVIARMYDATFDRLPDPGGLGVWTANLKAGMALIDIAAAFASSAEFQQRYGAVSNEQFVRQMYQFTLNREPDAAGLAAWTAALNAGTSRAQMLLNFSESAEHVALTASLWLGGIRVPGVSGSPLEETPDLKGIDDAFILPDIPDMDDTALLLPHKDDMIVICIDDEAAGYDVADEAFVPPQFTDTSILDQLLAQEHDTIQPRLDTFVF